MLRWMGWAGDTIYSFLAWCQYTQEGMVWIFLSFPLSLQTECCCSGSAERLWTLNESLGEILWPSLSLKVSPEDNRNYFTQDFCCYFRSTSSLGYPSHTPGTSDQQQELASGQQVHFWISSEFCMKIRLKCSQEVERP